MGCVSSNLLSNEEDFPQLGSSALGHHIVSLTSSTYGLLNLDPPPTPSPPTTTPSTPPLLWSLRHQDAEVINSWDLMSGLDAESFRFPPILYGKARNFIASKENFNPNSTLSRYPFESRVLLPMKDASFSDNTRGFEVSKLSKDSSLNDVIDEFDGFHLPKPLKDASFGDIASGFGLSKYLKEDGVCCVEKFRGFRDLCPPNGENKVVIYTTSLRGIRKTFEDCNAVRSAIEGFGVAISERDVSMDRGFREELRGLMKKEETVLPRVFVKGKYIGGVEEVTRIVEEGWMEELLKELPKKRAGELCEGCGNARFLPCFSCNGSCKMVINVKEEAEHFDCRDFGRNEVVVRCPDCNENGLVLCPICS